MMLGLRTKAGVDLKMIKEKFGIDVLVKYADRINYFKKLGFIDFINNNIFVTETGMPVLNKIILEMVT